MTYAQPMSEAKAEGLAPEQDVPPLRDDLELIPGPRNWRGEPSWTIRDPARARFFQFPERDFHLLHAWSAGSAQAICDAAEERSGSAYSLEELEGLLDFLAQSELLDVCGTRLRDRLSGVATLRKQGIIQTILHKYLFFRLPLIHPDRLLDKCYRLARPMLRRWFISFSLILGLIGVIQILRNFELFLASFSWLASGAGIVTFGMTLAVVKVLHEMGHALMCKHYGLRVPTMGVAFLVMWPVLYTDASESWRLVSKRQRAMIAAAGVLIELLLACYALFAWSFLPEGAPRAVSVTIATTALLTSVLVNLNPLMKFDGYYFLSDSLGFPNLQERSFGLAKWHLRKVLFGSEAPCPEDLPHRMRRFCIGYAWAILVYRFFLFLGIAVLVYHFFFKALGIVLFAVEIWWFILRPIFNEIRHWGGHAVGMSVRYRRVWWSTGALLLFLLLFPWRSDVALPAVLVSAQDLRVYPPREAVLAEIRVENGTMVEEGDLLARLVSPDLDQKLKVAQAETARLQELQKQVAASEKMGGRRLVVEQELVRALAEEDAIRRELSRLLLRAPRRAVVRDMPSSLRPGQWLDLDSRLMTLVAPTDQSVRAWATEDDQALLQEGDGGRFYADSPSGPQALKVVVTYIGRAPVRVLDPPYQASVYGGRVPTQPLSQKDSLPEPLEAVFPLQAVPEKSLDVLAVQQRGVLVLAGQRRSLLLEGATRVLATLIREGGF